ncbi:MAG: tetratricopeptide repeat protein [Bacteroidota bacterium]|nr:tetratricopeptide repeat protein [Bacteroidota bacterium]MDP4232321.1 tetratricopeptide repeat protein [Bacteroidota bacterium]MDP4241460.1 tetratricopeptide repeat protein [Bacteroidota bacterium]MDP4286716.1 tetratricopeptide repeat protein [Bacteroidota bacterium]
MVEELIRRSQEFLKKDIERFRAMNYEALAQARQLSERECEADALRNIAIGERYVRNFDLARYYALMALNIERELGRSGAEAETLCVLGRISRESGDSAHAESYFLKAMEILDRAGESRGRTMALTSLGGLAFDSGRIDEALVFLQHAKALYEAEENEEGIAGLRINYSLIYLEQGDHDRAITEAIAAYRTFQRLDQPRNIVFSEANLGKIMARTGNAKAAREYYEAALLRASEVHMDSLQLEIENELAALPRVL